MTGRGRDGRFNCDVVIIGGCGLAGLPLGAALAGAGARVACYDTNEVAVATVNAGRLPFREPAAELPLRRAVTAARLTASADPVIVAAAEAVIVVAGDHDDAGLWPESIAGALADVAAYFRDGQTLILRAALAPGTTASAEKLIARLGIDMDVALCPERVAAGLAMTELYQVPQIVACRTARGLECASRLFATLTQELVPMTPEEAELAKLFTSAWRYISFAAANQLYMIATDLGLDYERIRAGLASGYPQAAGLPPAGLTAGPCLLTDVVALAKASAGCALGRAAIAVNQGLPGYLVSRLELRYDLAAMTVGVLGMAFKGASGDTRASLSYLLADLLDGRSGAVLRTDPLVGDDPGLVPLDVVLDQADLLVIGAPHPQYREIRTDKPVADLWNLLGRGVLI